jgi:hypothetical protein
MVKTQKEQIFYNKLLITQFINYQKMGYSNIKINNQNYSHGQPSKVGDYTPDLSAVLNDETTLCEVVTNTLMNEPQLIEKWKMLSRSGSEFHMIIPNNSLNEVKIFTKSNGINVNKYWYSKYC